MLAKKFQLKKDSAFKATYRVRHSYAKSGVILWVGRFKSETQKDFQTKVGFVVSKKAHKRSVRRNRLKRLMRESYRLMLKSGELGNSQNYLSLIFTGLDKAVGRDFKEISSAVSFLIKSIK